MHVLGKVLAILSIIAMIVAALFTAKLIHVRTSWQRKSDSFNPKLAKAETDWKEAEERRLKSSRELESVLREWAPVFPRVPATKRIAPGQPAQLQVEMGSNVGLKDKDCLYGFELQPDGSSVYRGMFTLVQVVQTSAILQPRSKLAATEDADKWKESGDWRFRVAIPPELIKHQFELEAEIVGLEEFGKERGRLKVMEETALDTVKKELQQRQSALLGGPDLPKDATLPAEFRKGLVTAILEEEEARNKVLVQVDELRRQVRAKRAKIETLQKQNQELAAQLPQAESPKVSSRP